MLQCKAELDQFIEGLKVLGVFDSIRDHHSLLKPKANNQPTVGINLTIAVIITIIVAKCIFLTLVDIRKLLQVQFSEKGSSAREREEATYMPEL